METARLPLTSRPAQAGDLDELARMNRALIEDEGSRNPMTPAELRERMRRWLEDEAWQAVVFENAEEVVGYAVYRVEPDSFDPARPAVYLRQLFIRREHRRQGCGRAAFRQLTTHHFPAGAEVTLDVLATNPRGLAFWEAAGLAPYATVMRGRG